MSPLGEGGDGYLICYEALRKKQRGEEAYIEPLRNTIEFSGQPFSSNEQSRFFSLSKLSPWQIHLQELLCKHSHVSFSKLPDLSFTIGVFEGAL